METDRGQYTADKGAVVVEQKRTEVSWNAGNFHDSYQLLQKWGGGACATIYTAIRHSGEAEEVVVKITDLREDRNPGVSFGSGIDKKRCKEVASEVALLQALSRNRHIAGCIEAWTHATLSYVILEKCPFSLWRTLERTPVVNEASVRALLLDMIAGIASIHSVGIVHRDIKPDNFVCGGEPLRVKLCDFGFARQLTSTDPQAVGLRGIYGTAPFMAPEMLRRKLYGAKVDVWSFGVIAYVLFFGQFPYMPIKFSSSGMKAAIAEGTPPPTFEPKPSLSGSGCGAISGAAKTLLRMVLCRAPMERPTGVVALQDPYFQTIAPAGAAEEASLRPMLFAARNCGAFDLRSPQSVKTDMDVQLAAEQSRGNPDAKAKLLGAPRQRIGSPEASTAAGSEATSSLSLPVSLPAPPDRRETDVSLPAQLSRPGSRTGTPAAASSAAVGEVGSATSPLPPLMAASSEKDKVGPRLCKEEHRFQHPSDPALKAKPSNSARGSPQMSAQGTAVGTAMGTVMTPRAPPVPAPQFKSPASRRAWLGNTRGGPGNATSRDPTAESRGASAKSIA